MRFVICDSDTKYLAGIGAYIAKANILDFEIITCASVDQALSQSLKRGFEILLVGESTYDERVRGINARKVIILQENGFSRIRDFESVSKYQSVNKLIGQVLDKYASDESCVGEAKGGRNDTSLITFYSPEHHGAQSLSALAAAQLLSDRGNSVMYMNLHSFIGFSEMAQSEPQSDITDFMYFALKRSDKLLYKLQGMKQNIRGVDYLAPATDHTSLANIKPEEWKTAIETVMYGCEYTHIVVDLSENCRGFYEILDKSDKAYILYHNSKYGRSSFTQFCRCLTDRESNRVLDRIIPYSLPYEIVYQEVSLHNLMSSDIGNHMRGVIE